VTIKEWRKSESRPWLVLHCRGARIASFPLTDNNVQIATMLFGLSLIQRDITGTEHHDVMRVPSNALAKQLHARFDYSDAKRKCG
jgi:hypothetical protein